MKFFAGVKVKFDANHVPHLFLCLKSEEGTLRFEAQSGSGAFNHIFGEQLKGVDYQEAEEMASSDFGSVQPIQMIELDDDDLNHLTRYRVNLPHVAGRPSSSPFR